MKKGDLEQAEKYLEKALKLGQEESVRRDAGNLLRNIKAAKGELAGELKTVDRSTRAKAALIQKEVQKDAIQLETRQSELILQGLLATR